MKIKRLDTGEFYDGGYGTKAGPQWTGSKFTCISGDGPAVACLLLMVYEALRKTMLLEIEE